jgi:uncharacterized protein YecT (DUF1311 family)
MSTSKRFSSILCVVLFCLPASRVFAQTDCETQEAGASKACIEQSMRDSDKRINDVYKKVMTSLSKPAKADLRKQQRAWLKSRDKACKLDNKESNREKWMQNILASSQTAICVIRYTKARETELAAILDKKAAPSADDEQYASLEDPKDFMLAVDEPREKGKWYYEVTADIETLLKNIGNFQFSIGYASKEVFMAPIFFGRKSMIEMYKGKKKTYGFAIDLDSGKFYVIHNGRWDKTPGSAEGIDVKLGRFYAPLLMFTEPWKQFSCCVSVNLGDTPFTYELPSGYSPLHKKN